MFLLAARGEAWRDYRSTTSPTGVVFLKDIFRQRNADDEDWSAGWQDKTLEDMDGLVPLRFPLY